MNFFTKALGSGLFTGYFPFASGTVASIVATLIYFIPGFEKIYILIPLIIFLIIISIPIGNRFEREYGKDPSFFTLDEFIGTWISYLFLPKNFLLIIITFLLWRILDILKPFPARKLENLNGGLGIVIDDIISGIYTCILMNIVFLIFY
ncbi:MAG: phosphatidylglycerophosphatase A [Ignavibacterium sp.]